MLHQQINKEALRSYAMVILPVAFLLYALVLTGNTAVMGILIVMGIVVAGTYLRDAYGLAGTEESVEEAPAPERRSRSDGKKFNAQHHMTIKEAESMFRDGMLRLMEYQLTGAVLGFSTDDNGEPVAPTLTLRDGTVYELGLRDFKIVHRPYRKQQAKQVFRPDEPVGFNADGSPRW